MRLNFPDAKEMFQLQSSKPTFLQSSGSSDSYEGHSLPDFRDKPVTFQSKVMVEIFGAFSLQKLEQQHCTCGFLLTLVAWSGENQKDICWRLMG